MLFGVCQRGDGQVRFSKPETGNEAMSVEFTSIATDVTDPNFLVSGQSHRFLLNVHILSASLTWSCAAYLG